MKSRLIAGVLSLSLVLMAGGMSMTAQAELKPGDTGDAVRELQTLLAQDGWFFYEPDGEFGQNTEQAVKIYQRQSGLEVTGIADDTMIQMLRESVGAVQPDQAAPAAADEGTGGNTGTGHTDHCVIEMKDGVMQITYCEDHYKDYLESEKLLTGSLESIQAATALWVEDLEEIYEKLIAEADEEKKLDVLAGYTAWQAYCDQERTAWTKMYPRFPALVEMQMEKMMRDQVTNLCAALDMAEGGV